MIPVIQTTIDVSEVLDPKLSKRTINAAMFNCFSAMKETHQKMLPRHTDSGASTKYGYAMRSTQYVKRMRAAGIDWRPLKASGELKKSLQENQRLVVPQGGQTGRMIIKAVLGNTMWITPSGKTRRVGVTDRFRMKEGQHSLSKAQEQMLQRKAEITATTQDERDKIGIAGAVGFKKFIASGNRTRVRVR